MAGIVSQKTDLQGFNDRNVPSSYTEENPQSSPKKFKAAKPSNQVVPNKVLIPNKTAEPSSTFDTSYPCSNAGYPDCQAGTIPVCQKYNTWECVPETEEFFDF